MPSRTASARGHRGLRFTDVLLGIVILGLVALIVARLDRVETRKVVGAITVNDGDSITLGNERIRLRGIDAPELYQTCRRDQAIYACGREAKAALADLVDGQPVICEGWEHDRYGRLLGRCSRGTTDINKWLVEQGWAVAYGDFEAEELAARRAKRGLWAGEFERPKLWRDTHGSLVEPDHDTLSAAINWLRAILGLAGASADTR